MRGSSAAITGVALLSSLATAAQVDPLIIKLPTPSYIRGVAYQKNYDSATTSFSGNGYTDPLANTKDCKRDIPYLARLSTNVIRTYAIDPTLNHDACMSMLADAGIYVISDLSQPKLSIESFTPEWNTDLFQRYIQVVDALSKYPNTIGFFAGNEVTEWPNQTEAAAFVKAAVRDTKAYIKSKESRPLYVGYATADVPIRDELASYYNCGDQTDAVDFWGYNVYSWCGNSTYKMSGYKYRTEFFRDYSVPAFFAEYGCNKVEPRTWEETPVIYGPKMAPVWAGAIAYQYFQSPAPANFGLVTINGDTVTPNQDFLYLSSRLAKISPSSTAFDAVSTSYKPFPCPALNASWSATASPLPPTPNEQLCSCLEKSLGCVVSDSVNPLQYGKLFSYVCGKDPSACDGIAHDAHTGDYGAYSVCSSKQQLSYVINKYYENNGKNSYACKFDGQANTQTPSSSGNCNSLLTGAGKNGGGSTGAGSGGGSSAATGLTVPMPEVSILQLGLYVVVAGLTGAGMLLL